MTKFAVMTDVNIVEGVTASVTFPGIIFFLKKERKFTMYFATMISWFITWIMRKFSVNLFLAYKTIMGEQLKTYYISLPFSF